MKLCKILSLDSCVTIHSYCITCVSTIPQHDISCIYVALFKSRAAFANKLNNYSKAEGADQSDVLFAIGKSVFGVELESPAAKKAKTNDAPKQPDLPIVDFDYMKAFMKEVFISYGVPPDRAETCSDVLIEADKRGK